MSIWQLNNLSLNKIKNKIQKHFQNRVVDSKYLVGDTQRRVSRPEDSGMQSQKQNAGREKKNAERAIGKSAERKTQKQRSA